MHAAAPDPLYLPLAQCMHLVKFFNEIFPAAHEVQLDAPMLMISPALQLSQLVCPVAAWYRPASQSSHAIDPFFGCTLPPEQAVHPVEPDKAA